MKGYLVHKGIDHNDLRKKDVQHNLKKLREMCLKYGDTRFSYDPLIFVTDTLGDHLMEDGGIRYPDKKNMTIYGNQFEKALKKLQEITGEIGKELGIPNEALALLYEGHL